MNLLSASFGSGSLSERVPEAENTVLKLVSAFVSASSSFYTLLCSAPVMLQSLHKGQAGKCLCPVGRTNQVVAKEPQPSRELFPDDASSSRSVQACSGRGQLPDFHQIFKALEASTDTSDQFLHCGVKSIFLFSQFYFNIPHLPKKHFPSDLTSPITPEPSL